MIARSLTRPTFGAILMALVATALPGTIHAGLSGPPQSYVMPVGDGTKMLVMFAPVPLAKDRGDLCELPTGEKVSLRETFPASGLYENGSATPIWTVDWFAGKWLITLSPDCRYLVRFNEFGDGGFQKWPGRKLNWGIKFYDKGEETMTQDVAALVDYPSLMRWTTSDWHLIWFDSFDLVESQDHELLLEVRTSTRDRYRFDVRTGELLEERRFWRHVVKWSIMAAVLAGAGALYLIFRWLTLPRRVVSSAEILPDKRFTFNLRSLLLVVTLMSIFFGVSRFAPRAAILVSGLGICGSLTVWLYRARRRSPWAYLSQNTKRRRCVHWSSTLASWLTSYLLCFPVYWLLPIPLPSDFQIALYHVVYAPLIWLQFNTHVLRWPPIAWYVYGNWG